MSLLIGLTRGSGSPKYLNYEKWLRSSGQNDIKTVDLFVEDLETWLPKVDGVLFTGGGDIDPSLYGMGEKADVCEGVDIERDRREGVIFEYAREKKIPVLGVCRGIQYIVVHLGGHLIPHIPEVENAEDYHAKVDGSDNRHEVNVETGTLLFRAVGETEGEVNSSHHQGVEEVPATLSVTARAPDGIVEGLEWKEPEKENYMVAVQWHPERMEFDSPFSAGLRDSFLLEVESSQILRRTSMPIPKEESDIDVEAIRARESEKKGGGESAFELPVVS